MFVWGSRAGPLLRLFSRFKTTPSQFRSQFLVITINFSSGSVDGEVIAGEHEGKRLNELSPAELKKLSEQYKQTDKESFILLQAFMLRSGSSSNHSDSQYKPSNLSDVPNDQAYEILGLPKSASKDEVVKAHKRLMQRIHPDRGGSDYLAAKINAAKDQLTK
jgi:hypothetical protein